MVHLDIAKYHALVIAPEIEILKPDEVAFILAFFDDCLAVSEAWEDRGDEAGRSYSFFMEFLHCGYLAFNGDRVIHSPAEYLIKGVDGEGYSGLGECFYEIDVA